MKKFVFLIDSEPKWKNQDRLDDYNAKLISSFITYPLFKYSTIKNDYTLNAAEIYCTKKGGKKHYVKLKKCIRDYKGKDVGSEEYAAALNSIWMKSDARFFWNRISVQTLENNWICIKMKYADPTFYKVLSRIEASPENCGAYFINERNKLKRNEFWVKDDFSYSRPDNIDFKVVSSPKRNLQMLRKSEANISSNMLFLNRCCFEEIRIEESEVYVGIRFKSDYLKNNYKMRRRVFDIIEQIDFQKYNQSLFCVKKKKKILKKVKVGCNKNFIIGCTDFYPNVNIAYDIKNALKKNGIGARVLIYDYIAKQECDIEVSVSYLPYYDKFAFYGSSVLVSDIVEVGKSNILYQLYRTVYLVALRYPKYKIEKILKLLIRKMKVYYLIGYMKSSYMLKSPMNFNFIDKDFI